jgi:hypothetical protein
MGLATSISLLPIHRGWTFERGSPGGRWDGSDRDPEMKLPNGESAKVDLEKLVEYCLNPDHPRGGHKAIAFRTVLGLTTEDVEELRDRLLVAAREEDAFSAGDSAFGALFTIDFLMQRHGRHALVRSCWIVETGHGRPRLTSCFIRKKRRGPHGRPDQDA